MNRKQKNLIALVLIFAMAIMPMTTINNNKVNAATNEVVNLALNATVTTSSNENDALVGKYAVDGDSATRWASAWNDGEWIMVDLGEICTVSYINIQWEAAYASNYSIYWSQDNVTWNLALTQGVSSSTEISNMFYNRPVRYIKVVCNTRATEYGVSMYELKVMGYKNETVTETETTTEAVTEVETTTEAVIETPTTSTTTNLALGKSVTSSSNENDSFLAKYAVDGDSGTRWSSEWNDGEWIMVDLGAIYTVGCVNVEWEAAYASTYTIMWSQDNVTWYTAATKTINSAAKTTDMFYNRPVRYIKVVCDKRATAYGSSMYELEVMGQSNQVATETTTEAPTTEVATEVTTEAEETTTEEVISNTTNLALGKTVVSSSDENDSYLAKYAVDGDAATRWSSAWKDGEWIMVDLGKLYNVGSITIDWEAAFASKYTVSWSQDGETWYDALTYGTSAATSKSHMMYNRPIRYIKITANTRGTSYGVSIYEIKVFGSAYNPNYVYTK